MTSMGGGLACLLAFLLVCLFAFLLFCRLFVCLVNVFDWFVCFVFVVSLVVLVGMGAGVMNPTMDD